MNKRTLVIAIVILALAVGGFFGYRRLTASAQSDAADLQTASVERGTLTAAVSAAGSIAAPQSAPLTWRASGIVGAVHVKIGERVKAGQVLMELDLAPAFMDASVAQAQVNLIEARQTLEELTDAPSALELAQAEQAVVDAAQAVEDAQRSLNGVLYPDVAYYQTTLDDALIALQNAQSQQTITNIGTIGGAINSAQKAMEQARDRLGAAQVAEAACGGCDPDRLRKAQEAYDTAVNELTTARLQMQVAQAGDDQAIREAQEAVDTAQRDLAAAQAGPNASDVAQTQATLVTAQAQYDQAQQALADLKDGPDPDALAAAEARVAAAQASVDQARLIAPFDATVVAVYSKVGDSVNNNSSAIALADLSSLLVTVDVSEVDVNRILVRQEAVLTLDAASGQTFVGRVADVALVGTVNQGVVTFPVTVVADDPDPALRPGMTAAVSIVTDRREAVLLVPNRAVRLSAGQRIVTALFEGQQISVPVTLGLIGDTMSEVVEGSLQAGDTVVLNATSAQTGFTPGVGFFGGAFRP